MRAHEYFVTGMKQAYADWITNAQRDVQAAYARDAAARQQALEIVQAIANIALAVAAIKTGQPVHQFAIGQ